ncbi:MAG TPA: GspH/FimT family pseudopilin [Gammaproteobacteria bacterium]
MEKAPQNGFTLMELLVTLSVAAILMAIGAPGMQEFVQNNRRAAEVNNMIATLQVARSEAVARNQEIGICASTDSAGCSGSTTWDYGWIVFVDLDSDGIRDAAEELLQVSAAPEGMTVRATFQGVNYRPNGRVLTTPDASTSGDITFCDSRGADEARVVRIGISGRPETSGKRLGGAAPTCP